MYHISGTVKHMIMIFWNFYFWAVRGLNGQKLAQDDKKILSVALHISWAMYDMIIIYDTVV